MFSPEPSGPAASTRSRNPRRRTRNTSSDTQPTRKASKKPRRSSLLPQTFVPPQADKRPANSSRKVSGQEPAGATADEGHLDGPVQTSLTLRGRGARRGGERRASVGERRILLTKNDHYTLAVDPNIPDEVRNLIDHAEEEGPWRVSVAPRLGYVALTPSRAIVWKKGGNQPTNAPTAYTLRLPDLPATHDPKDQKNLPLGALVHDAGAGDTALLVVLPATRRILYWESVQAAARADARRQRAQALEGPIPHLGSYEAIDAVFEAEPDAFILSTSAGQLLHVSVRDPQGRPALSVHVLGGNPGWWGSIRGALRVGGGSGERVVAVRPDKVIEKSRRRCVTASARGTFRIWELVRNGARTLERETDARTAILNAVLGEGGEDRVKEKEEAEVVVRDFVLFPDEGESGNDEEEESDFRVLIIASVRAKGVVRSYMFDATLHPATLHINVVQSIESVNSVDSGEVSMDGPCRLLLPRPAHTAIIIFASRIVLLALTPAIDSADMQLQMESAGPPPPFEDALCLLQDRGYDVVGCATDDADDASGAAMGILFVNNYGMIRLSTAPAPQYASMTDEARRAALCQTKLEQAVFFGAVNPPFLDFGCGIGTADWSPGELEETALQVDAGILDSSSAYVSTLTPSMDQQLAQRATALAALIHAIRSRADLSTAARWTLLGSAEKMAFASAVWRTHEGHLKNPDSDPRAPSRLPFLPELVDMISEQDKHENRPERGETDAARHFLVHDVASCGLIIPWCAEASKQLFEQDGVTQPVQQAAVLAQANQIYIRGLEAVVRFRASHLSAYGLGDDPAELLDDDGVYQGSYLGMPEPWTATAVTTKYADKLFDLTADAAERDDISEPLASPTTEIAHEGIIRIACDAPALARWSLRTLDERTRWLQGHNPEGKPNDVQRGRDLAEAAVQVRFDVLVHLGDSLAQPDPGIALAERYADVNALSELIACAQRMIRDEMDEIMRMQPRAESPTAASAVSLPVRRLRTRLDDYDAKIDAYFGIYGYAWATAYYTGLLKRKDAAGLFERGHTPFLAQFLASNPAYARLRWIHAVLRGKDFGAAREALVTCLEDEGDWWRARTMVSLAKLAALAEHEQRTEPASAAAEASCEADLKSYEARLAAAEMQSRVRAALEPLTRRAIDKTAAVELAVQALGGIAKKRKAYAKRFEAALELLLADRWLPEIDLLDLLTLMAPPEPDEGAELDWNFMDLRFVEALQVLRAGPWEGEERELARRLIWVRCLLRDDWVALNRTEEQDDASVSAAMQNTILFHTLAVGLQRGLVDHASPPLAPSALLASGPPSYDDLTRSEALGDQPEPARRELARDLAADWAALKRAVEKGRLDRWWDGILSAAEEMALQGPTGAGDDGAAAGEEEGVGVVDEQGDVVMG